MRNLMKFSAYLGAPQGSTICRSLCPASPSHAFFLLVITYQQGRPCSCLIQMVSLILRYYAGKALHLLNLEWALKFLFSCRECVIGMCLRYCYCHLKPPLRAPFVGGLEVSLWSSDLMSRGDGSWRAIRGPTPLLWLEDFLHLTGRGEQLPSALPFPCEKFQSRPRSKPVKPASRGLKSWRPGAKTTSL